MLFSLLLRSLVPALLLLSQVPAIAITSSSRANLGTPAQTSPSTPTEVEKLKKEIESLQSKIENQQKEFQELKDYQKNFMTEQQIKLGDQQKYNSDLMNTVFFSLLGSVLTVTAGVLAVKIYADAMEWEHRRKELIQEAKRALQYFLEQKLRLLETRTGWLEYQIATLAANQSEQRRGLVGLVAIQDRLRAIQALRRISSKYEQEMALKPIRAEMIAIQLSLETFASEDLASLDEAQRTELEKFSEKIRKSCVSFLSSIEGKELEGFNMTNSDIKKIQESLSKLPVKS
jgi:hypothetical protein